MPLPVFRRQYLIGLGGLGDSGLHVPPSQEEEDGISRASFWRTTSPKKGN